jgi:hypothetical protein
VLEAAVSHPDVRELMRAMGAAATYATMTEIVEKALGEFAFMEFVRFDLGVVLRKQRGPGTPQSLRLVIGNPLIMNEMLEHVPDTGS